MCREIFILQLFGFILVKYLFESLESQERSPVIINYIPLVITLYHLYYLRRCNQSLTLPKDRIKYHNYQ